VKLGSLFSGIDEGAEMRDYFRLRVLDRVRHRTCGGEVQFVLGTFECACTRWTPEGIENFSDQDMKDRFELLPGVSRASYRLVYKVDGKRRFLTLVPNWDTASYEPSGLS
jgi:hypothetical protein